MVNNYNQYNLGTLSVCWIK